MNKYKLVVTKKVVFYYWKIVSVKSGQVIATSVTYFNRSSCVRTAQAVSDLFNIEMEIK